MELAGREGHWIRCCAGVRRVLRSDPVTRGWHNPRNEGEEETTMVLPLIPVALIAAGALTGSGGLALGGFGAYDLKKADGQIKKARERYDRRYVEIEACVAAANDRITDLGGQQKRAIEATVVRFVEFLERHEKAVRVSAKLLADGVECNQTRVSDADKLSVDPLAWLGGAIGSAVAYGGTSAAVMTTATSVGVASTGAAISGLSGVAATNATMAWLGGGSLAAGGGGMAAGAAALNFVTVGPALLVGGVMVKGQGKKALTQARETQAKIAVEIAKLDETETRLSAVISRAGEISALLEQLATKAIAALDELESEPFDPVAHAPRLQRAMQLTKAVGDVAAVPIVDDDGDLTERSASVWVKYRPMAEETENG
ncbi:hypothetical protein [Rhodococcus kronopolitis]|uniref:Uncharacterized protein n=1 Tax=Rhodococcus kronopolitis TaxID=1460226 RepID=A0ABV9FX59_9NOCA